MEKIIVGTGNAKKAIEIKNILDLYGYEVLSFADFAKSPEIVEDGDSFAANAAKKAIETSKFYDCFALADDSGLEVEALNNQPGIFSARYAGEHGNDTANNEKLLQAMQGVEESQRGARFVCAVALANKGELIKCFEGEIKGRITERLIGENGFGYDPLFFVPEFGKTTAELTPEEKNKISHRYKAFSQAAAFIKNI